ncbi:MAG: Nif3-like dinuclear metal center hexameric protein, partial [Pseudomonadota bacterium]
SHLGFAVSSGADVIQKAIHQKVQGLVVHHGLFWKHQGARPIVGAFAQRINPLIKHGINLFAYHLPLDAHLKVGNNAVLAERLKLKKISLWGKHQNCPIGISGEFSRPVSIKNLQHSLQEILGHKVVVSVPAEKENIRKVAIVTGAGGSFLPQAAKGHFDAFITGEASEHHWYDSREEGLALFACGHHASETLGIQALMAATQKKFKIDCFFIPSDNPF